MTLLAAARAAGVLAAAGSLAALPPEEQRRRETAAIAASAEVAARLAPHAVGRVDAAGPDLYRVEAGPCRLEVRIVDEARQAPGPRRFRLAVGAPACR